LGQCVDVGILERVIILVALKLLHHTRGVGGQVFTTICVIAFPDFDNCGEFVEVHLTGRVAELDKEGVS
jgi:hypothetical protein